MADELAALTTSSGRELHVQLVANLGEQAGSVQEMPHERYGTSDWYQEITKCFRTGELPGSCRTQVQNAAFVRKAARYKVLQGGDLYVDVRGVMKRYVTKEEVSEILRKAHDHGGHFMWTITLRRLRSYYWPGMSQDVKDYIAGCLICAKHGTVLQSQTLARVSLREPMEPLGIDFIGPFPRFDGVREIWILIAIDYFMRYIWAEAAKQSDSATVIRFLRPIFNQFGILVGIYMDPGPHFGNETRNFAHNSGVVWCNSPVAAKKATGMVEKAVDIL